MSGSEESPDEEDGRPQWPVTADWLEEIIAKHHGAAPVAVADYAVSPGCDAGESVLSDILAVSVRYTVSGHAHHLSLIVKLLPQDPFSRFFVTEAQFDLREIKFYTKVVPELREFQRAHLPSGQAPLELPIPRCYHASYSSDPPESVLVLENLKSCGYRGTEFSRGLTLSQTQSALAAVARLHALSLALKVKEGRQLDERYPFLFQTARASDSYQQLVERGLPQLAQFLERRPGLQEVLQCLTRLRPNTKQLIASLLAPKEPLALITHTDFWCNNLLFRDDDTCAVLDWQMVTYSRPTNDIALLIVSSVPTDLRRQHTTILLDGYWHHLTTTASQLRVDIETGLGYTRAHLDKDFQRSQLLALLLCIGSVDVALGDPLTEQRLLDILHDLHKDGIFSLDLNETD